MRCYAAAGTRSPGAAPRLRSDGLVPVKSALGVHRRRDRTLGFPAEHRLVTFATGHLGLLDAPEVQAALRAWLST